MDVSSKIMSLVQFLPSFNKRKFAYKGTFGSGHVYLAVACFYLGYNLSLYVNQSFLKSGKKKELLELGVKLIQSKFLHSRGCNKTWSEDVNNPLFSDCEFLNYGFEYQSFIDIWAENIQKRLLENNIILTGRLWVASGTGVMGESWVKGSGCKIVAYVRGKKLNIKKRSKMFLSNTTIIQGKSDYVVSNSNKDNIYDLQCNDEFELEMLSHFVNNSIIDDIFLNSSMF
jgi:hypothetical protein